MSVDIGFDDRVKVLGGDDFQILFGGGGAHFLDFAKPEKPLGTKRGREGGRGAAQKLPTCPYFFSLPFFLFWIWMVEI